MQVRDVISYRILSPAMTDWVFKDLLLSLPELQVKEIIVLPAFLRRAKQLLSNSDVRVGTVIDYPLGAGTIAKKAYEVGRAFQDGADFLELTVCLDTLLHKNQNGELLNTVLGGLATAWGEIRVRVNSRDLKELTKVEIAERIHQLGWRRLVLSKGDSLDSAKYDATLFSYDTEKNLELQINLETIDQEGLQELVIRGVKRVEVFDISQLDLTAELNDVRLG